jgi:hypothetical protein
LISSTQSLANTTDLARTYKHRPELRCLAVEQRGHAAAGDRAIHVCTVLKPEIQAAKLDPAITSDRA